MAKARRGRAPQGEYAGKTGVLSFRIRPDTKTALRKAAAAANRSLSQEAEHRLRRGLDEDETISSLWGGAKTLAMMWLAVRWCYLWPKCAMPLVAEGLSIASPDRRARFGHIH
jgi:hypothetical protein